jgi:hypothetical protein
MRWAIGLAGPLILTVLVLVVIAQQAPQPPARAPAPTARPVSLMLAAASTPAPQDGWDPVVSGSWHLLAAVLPLVLIALAGAGIYALVIHARRSSRLPTEDGRVPLARSDHDLAAEALRSLHTTHLAHAQAQAVMVPERLTATWSPRVTMNRAPDPVAAAPGPPQPLSWPALLALPGLVLGVADEGPVSEPEFVSVGIGGRPGSGKTTTAAVLVAQVVGKGGTAYVVDPHAGHSQGLLERLERLRGGPRLHEAGPTEAVMVAEQAADELRRRQRMARMGVPPPTAPAVLFLDEWTALMRGVAAERLGRLLTSIISEGRKYGVAAVLSAQSWNAGVVGGSFVRNPLPAAVVHRMRPDEARVLSGLRGDAVPPDVAQLPAGVAYAVGSWGVSRITVPDLRGEALSGPLSGHLPELDREPAPAGPGQPPDTAADSGHEVQILQLFRDGRSIADIVRAIFGLEPGGRAWQDAKAHVETIIRRAVSGQ